MGRATLGQRTSDPCISFEAPDLSTEDMFDVEPVLLRSAPLVAGLSVQQQASLGGRFTSRAQGPNHPGD